VSPNKRVKSTAAKMHFWIPAICAAATKKNPSLDTAAVVAVLEEMAGLWE
jgi:hypothetical protein